MAFRCGARNARCSVLQKRILTMKECFTPNASGTVMEKYWVIKAQKWREIELTKFCNTFDV